MAALTTATIVIVAIVAECVHEAAAGLLGVMLLGVLMQVADPNSLRPQLDLSLPIW